MSELNNSINQNVISKMKDIDQKFEKLINLNEENRLRLLTILGECKEINSRLPFMPFGMIKEPNHKSTPRV